MECAVSLLANRCVGGKRAGPVDIYTFPSPARFPVFAYTKLYLYYTRETFFSAVSMNLGRSEFVPSGMRVRNPGMRIRDPIVRESEDGTRF